MIQILEPELAKFVHSSGEICASRSCMMRYAVVTSTGIVCKSVQLMDVDPHSPSHRPCPGGNGLLLHSPSPSPSPSSVPSPLLSLALPRGDFVPRSPSFLSSPDRGRSCSYPNAHEKVPLCTLLPPSPTVGGEFFTPRVFQNQMSRRNV